MEFKEQVVEFLAKFPNSNARQIARALGCEKNTVNSLLYSNKNIIFRLHETSPPTWSILSNRVEKIKINSTHHRILNTSNEFHIDMQGGDWRVIIQIKDSSRNDPVVQLERTGPNSAIIQVSSSVVSNFKEDSEYFPDVVMALASSALAWEIAVQCDAALEEKFNFESTVRDVYLSLSVSRMKKG